MVTRQPGAPSATAAGPVRTLIRQVVPVRARYALRARLLARPSTAALYAATDPRLRAGSRVTPATDLVIEGFPRSANSYALAAFRLANPGCVTASHAHSYGLVRQAARIGVPAILLVRDPRDVLASCMLYDPDVPAPRILTEYVRMYAAAERHHEDYLLAEFDDVVDDFGRVVERCNARFGTRFAPYEKTEVSERAVARDLDAWAQADAAELPAHRMGRPGPRTTSTDGLLADLPRTARHKLDAAIELHRRLTGRPLGT